MMIYELGFHLHYQNQHNTQLMLIFQFLMLIVCYALETVWWLISWVIIGIVKLLILLVGNIVLIIPFILYVGGITMDVIIFAKSDKNLSKIISFGLSLLLCLIFGIFIFI